MMEKATETFLRVRDMIDPADHPVASRAMWTVPMAFYFGHSAEEAVAVILDYERDLLAGKYDSDILKRAADQSLRKIQREAHRA